MHAVKIFIFSKGGGIFKNYGVYSKFNSISHNKNKGKKQNNEKT